MPRIIGIGTSVPEFIATNDFVIALALENSRKHYAGDLDELERNLRRFLEKAGAKERRWRDEASKPIEHISYAWHNCLSKLGSDVVKDIGSLIYCGIDRGIVEPSHASLIAQGFGLEDARTLDVSDACMGWFTAVQAARAFSTPDRPYCAIVSAEFPMEVPGKVYPSSFVIRSDEDFVWKGSALTIGEAASVTIVDACAPDPARCLFKSNNALAHICCVPMLRADRFVDSQELLPQLSDDCFVAHMPTMASAAYRASQKMLTAYIAENGMPDTALPSGFTDRSPARVEEHPQRRRFEELFRTFRQSGDVVDSDRL